ncbi:uncharacterized protein NECHADRAFT_86154 [Fusarium vanettenii 77-13-4]|uniref:Uncharacterized protein n=1 Tax=Fusarium vanettenii (strain ATCC MYA-4622 / CBS 123669 / FGSC 9596 / NRRL 45880 / 77-13-4) TaxID=660122 RepID=C7Z1H5_FUSV7|nr:uncharacterized protein NECHADRAFT_86154 [Fusarium vanettenii 77-13-4]EEU42007.1 predicted protein [Fusarium vanettenii 77-13-4]
MDIPNIAFEGIREWASSDSPPGPRNVSFAHLKVSRHCMSDKNVWQVIIAGLWDAEWGVCVGSSLDAGTAYLAHAQLADDHQGDEGPIFEFLCYYGWRESLEDYRVADGAGLKCWNMDMAPTDSLCVAFVIDPQMSAECALGLIATVHWAADVSPQYMIRVLTISPEDAPRALRKLLYAYGLDSPYPISLNPPDSVASKRREVQKIIQASQKDFVQELQKESRGDLTRQAVISWHNLPHFDLDEDRHISRIAERDVYEQDRVFLVTNLTMMSQGDVEDRFSGLINDYRNSATARLDGCVIRFVPHTSRPPFPLDGFDNLHIFLSSHREQVIHDAVTGQLTRVNLPVCQEERLQQVAWAFRTRNVPASIAIYTEASSLDEFVSSGSHYRRLKVCNEQAGGFVAGVVLGFAHWGLDGPSIISCFFESNLERSAHINRWSHLHIQGILGDKGTSVGLVGKHSVIFNQVLQVLGFDHRLALLVALPSESAVVRQVKVQLAALLSAGIKRLFIFHDDVLEKDLVSHCQGWSKPLARTGSLWLALGLWKGLATAYDDFSTPRTLREAEDGMLTLVDSGVSFNLVTCQQINKTITTLCNLIMEQEIPMLPVRSFREVQELRPVEVLELQKHLLHAYIFQLTQQFDGLNGPMFVDLSTRVNIDQEFGIPHWTKSTLDFDRIKKSDLTGRGSIFGIYHGMERSEGSGQVRLSDWTWISTSVVAD